LLFACLMLGGCIPDLASEKDCPDVRLLEYREVYGNGAVSNRVQRVKACVITDRRLSP
jgi:hypothetical protein